LIGGGTTSTGNYTNNTGTGDNNNILNNLMDLLGTPSNNTPST
jgi:hypothetical protein